MHNLSQSGNSTSPGVNALGTPGLGGLGIEGITPGALHNISTPLGFAMSRTDSEIRAANNVAKRNEDEERRSKMRRVLKSIGRPKGRVSEEGIARLARRVGLVSDIDDEKLSQEERDRKVGNRSFSVAGDSVIVTLDLRDQTPQSVEVNGDVPEPEKAAHVLLRDLQESGDVALTANLDRFALNLSYLAQMDRLKKETDTDCFAAVGGVFQSLQRLYEKETEAAMPQEGPARAASYITCKKSGRPGMHERQRLGLSFDYWQQSRYSSDEHTSDESKMDVDADKRAPQPEDSGIWTIIIGAEKHNAAKLPYMPLRVSEQWLPDPLELPSEESGEGVKWLEPTDDSDALSKPCFVATLDPPVVLPYGAADAILKSLNIQSGPQMQSIPSYISLLLSTASGSHVTPPSAPGSFGSITSIQGVISRGHDDIDQVQHHYVLDNAKPDFGYLLCELPFMHPKQLVELLPTLRQWAALGLLLSQSFETIADSKQNGTQHGRPQKVFTLDSISLNDSDADEPTALAVNMALSTTPQTTLNVTFRTSSSQSSVANLDVQILRNADVAVEIYDGFNFSDDEAKAKAEATMAKALDVCWDLGVWIEWVRGRYS